MLSAPLEYVSQVCPICQTEVRILRSFSIRQVAEYIQPSSRNSERNEKLVRKIETLWNGRKADIVQCTSCHFTFPIPFVAGDAEFYELAYGDVPYICSRWEFSVARKFIQPNTRLLEIGAGPGRFIMGIRHLLSDVVATDYTRQCQASLRDMGVDVRSSPINGLTTEFSEYFDTICAFQVVEHLADPQDEIRLIRSMLRPGGQFIFSVPNGRMIDFNVELGNFELPPIHIGTWYKETFQNLADAVDMELVTHEVEPRNLWRNLYSVGLVRLHSAAWQNPKGLAARAQAIGNPTLRHLASLVIGGLLLIPLLPKIFFLREGYAQLCVLRRTT